MKLFNQSQYSQKHIVPVLHKRKGSKVLNNKVSSGKKPQVFKESKKQAEQKVVFRAEEMAQQVKVPATKSNILRLVPRSHTVEGENQHLQSVI